MGEEITKNAKSIPNAAVRRLPKYYRILCDLEAKGLLKVSSKQLSQIIGSTPSQVRQDFNLFGGFGHQGYGYSISALKEQLAAVLGIDEQRGIILVGCGNLGRAIANQMDFHTTGFRLIGIFDIDESIIGKNMLELTIMDMEELEAFCRKNIVSAAIICTPESAVKKTVKRLYSAGIKNYWNFTHYDIEHDYPDCISENVCLKDSLMVLGYSMNDGNSNQEK